ncbi:tectonic-3 [Heteronotia binoei]|uniref:tectonic-3 n=1 Tax=Heteronotia binoei TaxID=13085 RepID=UPI0029307B2D|nr:tectonic-3 [Heteronotia binoei]
MRRKCATPVSKQRREASEMTVDQLIILLLLLVSVLGKAEPEKENDTLYSEEEPSEKAESEKENDTLYSEKMGPNETPEVWREERAGHRMGSLSICPCDLHPGFCDLNCCCDSKCGSECSMGGSECPFSFCLPGSTRAVSRMCLEKSLIFRNNTPYFTEIVLDSSRCTLLFCVQLNNSKLNYFQKPQMITKENLPILSAQYGRPSFILPEQTEPSPSTFYRAGDPIQIYFAASSILSVLKQPASMFANTLCSDGNPAGFLESKSTSCIRIFTNLTSSCTTDPALNAASYYRDFSVLKVPVNLTVFQPSQVKIIPVSVPASPILIGNTCYNVVSEVIYAVEFNGIHGIQNISVQFKVGNIYGNTRSILQQRFSLTFWNKSPSFAKQRSGNPGYISGAPLVALCNGTQQYVTILQNQDNGQCSEKRYSILFKENVRTACQFNASIKLEEANCSHLQEGIYRTFQGPHNPDKLAITGNANTSQPGEWNSIFTQRCAMQDGHCMIPISLEIQVIWAQVGLLSNPQAQVLGARYLYICKPLQSLGMYMNMLPLTTTVAFTDVTKRPESPHSQPKAYWKLPFDFFFPFKMALDGVGSISGSQTSTLLVTLTLCGVFVL